jgi:DNA-binding CsgD family transcriptional regulator
MAETVPLAGVLDAAAAVARGQIAIRTGDAARLRRCLAYTEALRSGGTLAVLRHASWLAALAALAASDIGRAHRQVRMLVDPDAADIEPRLPHDVTDEIEIVRIALAARDAALAALALATAQQRRDRNPAVTTIAGVAAHCRGLCHDSSTDLDEAIEAFAAGPRPLALASALEDAGRLSARRGVTDRGIGRLGRALEIYVGCGASWDAARVRGHLRELGVRRRLVTTSRPRHGWAGLTESELNVVRLVARGLTNREAAERLYLSVHTVGSHLRSAFAKLGIKSRVELANLVTASGGPVLDPPEPAAGPTGATTGHP